MVMSREPKTSYSSKEATEFITMHSPANSTTHKSRTQPNNSKYRESASTTPTSARPRENDKNGAVTITLHTTKDNFDETAEVKVELSNPETVVEKMLHTLAHKFPPESVMTIATNGNIPSDESSSAPDESHDSASSSETSVGLSPIGEGLHKPNRLSGRHYLGPNGEFYPELADAKGRPIGGYVREPNTGGAFPVGRPAYGNEGRSIRGMIVGPNGKPIPGIAVPPEGLDEFGHPQPCYEAIDGTFPCEATGPDGRPLLGFAIDPKDGQIKRVGAAVVGQDKRTMPGMIRGPNGEIMPGIPLKPVQRPKLQASNSGSHARSSVPYPTYADATQVPMATGTDARACHPIDGQTKPVGLQYYGLDGTPVPNMVLGNDGRPVPGIAIVDQTNATQSKERHQPRSPSYTGKYQHPRERSHSSSRRPRSQNSEKVVPMYAAMETSHQPVLSREPFSPDGRRSKDGKHISSSHLLSRTLPGYTTAADKRSMESFNILETSDTLPQHRSHHHHNDINFSTQVVRPQHDTPSYPHSLHSNKIQQSFTTIKIPAPSYSLIDGTYTPLAVGSDGRPIDGYAQDPKSKEITRVGRPCRRHDGTIVPGMIHGPDGQAMEGLQLADHSWDVNSQQPLPHYHTQEGHWAPMYVGSDGRLVHGWARNPITGSVQPVGLQVVGEYGIPVKGMVVGPDGRPVHGIALDTSDQDISIGQSTDSFQGTMLSHGAGSHMVDEDGCVVRYVEVPVVEEKIVHVQGKREIRHVDKKVPKEEIVEVYKDVQVPQIHYIDKVVEVPQIEECLKEVRVKQVIDRPYDVIVHRPRPETQLVEKIVEVPGQIIEVPKIERIEHPVYVPRYIDKEVPTVVAQRLQPVVGQISEICRVPCTITEPKIVTVDVFVPKPVVSQISVAGRVNETHKTVNIPAAHYNALMKRLNINLDSAQLEQLFVKEGAGVPILPVGEKIETVEPVSADWAANHHQGVIHCSNATEIPHIQVQETLGLKTNEREVPIETTSFLTRGSIEQSYDNNETRHESISTSESLSNYRQNHHHSKKYHEHRHHHSRPQHHNKRIKENEKRTHRHHKSRKD